MPGDPVYDFFFAHDFEPKFCNAIEYAASQGVRQFQEFILKLHTGESVIQLRGQHVEDATMQGQVFLRAMADSMLSDFVALDPEKIKNPEKRQQLEPLRRSAIAMRGPSIQAMLGALELDGYAWTDGHLVHRDSTPVDAEKHRELLLARARELGLSKQDVLAHNLKLSEDAYQESRWEDCVGNARKAMELAFQECAALWSRRVLSQEIDPETYKWPGEVRKFLEAQGLLTEDEKKAAAANYGMFSGVGNHPYIAQNDQARMGRQIALIMAEFVMLRTREALKAKGK